MSDKPQENNQRCREIRSLLPGFLCESLDVAATGEIQGHLVACQPCSESYAELIMQEIENGAEELRAPPQIPPIEWYDIYLAEKINPPGVLWSSLRLSSALKSADPRLAEWARGKLDQLGEGLRQLLQPPVALAFVRVRGVQPAMIAVTVINSTWEPTGQSVSFSLIEPPQVTSGGRFRLRLQTTSGENYGRQLFCALSLPGAESLIFSSELQLDPLGKVWEAVIDEPGWPTLETMIPQQYIKLSLLDQ